MRQDGTGGRRALARGPVALLLCMVPLLAACPRKPLDFGPRGRVTDGAALLHELEQHAAKVRTVRGQAKASMKTPQGGGKAGQFVIAERPDRLRLEVISFFGQPAAVLTSDGATYALHDLEHGHFMRGPATAANVSRLLPLRVEPADLVSLLLGVPPLLAGARPLSLELDRERGAYVLVVGDGFQEQQIGIDTATLKPKWTAMPGRGLLSPWRAEFEGYDGSPLPRKVRLESTDGKSSVQLSWGDRELNEPVDPSVFRQEVPPGAVPVDPTES